MDLWDTHCHLTFPPLCGDLPAVLARGRAAGVSSIVVPSYDVASWGAVAALSALDGVRVALGVHPWVSNSPGLTGPEVLSRALDSARASAVGEIGLDFKVDGADGAAQMALLEMQLDVAEDKDLPVLLHCRGAFEEMLAILRRRQGRVRGVVHAFSRGPELAMRFVDVGLHVAFGGAITRPSAHRARRAAALVPVERLLLETDAPSIGLEGVPPVETEPRHVENVASALAEARGLAVAEIAAITTDNARNLFG